MLDIHFIKEHRDIIEAAIKNKKTKTEIDLGKLLDLYEKRKELQTKLDDTNAARNQAAQAQNIEEGKRLKQVLAEIEAEKKDIDTEYKRLMLAIPNIPSPDTPIGEDESGNVVLRQVGELPQFDFKPKAHWDLGAALGIIDNEKAAEVSGARFTYLKGDLTLLQFALINYGFSLITSEENMQAIIEEAGLDVSPKPFVPVVPPSMVKSAVLNRMARLEPKEDKYFLKEDDLFLTGSAEHTLGPIHMDEMLTAEQLPLRYVGYGTAFRREAGSYGKDTKGILRMHQFDKLEMETFCAPETSYQEQDLLVAIQEYLMRKLKLPYQVVQICTGDMGIPDHRQIDIETWMPGQQAYRETHTADLNTSFQPRRLNTRFKRNQESKPEFVHMNDATMMAIGRLLIAIMENYQQADGTIRVPDVLQPLMGGKAVIAPLA
jgi:seryl-tRNA synthetase